MTQAGAFLLGHLKVQHIIKLDSSGQPCLLYRCDLDSKQCQTQDLHGWASVPQSHECHLLLPAAWVYHTQAAVPSTHTEVLRQSVPFAIEEELSNDLHDNHVAFAAIGPTQQAVAVVSRQHMDDLKVEVQKHRLKIVGMFSWADFCPRSEALMHVMFDDQQAVLRLGSEDVMVVSLSELENTVGVFGEPWQEVRTNRSSHNMEGKRLLPPFNLVDCVAALGDVSSVNLLPKQWLSDEDKTAKQSIKKMVVVAALLLLSWIGITVHQNHQLNNQIESIKAKQLDALKSVFSDVGGTELLDPYGAWQSRLKSMNQDNDTTHSPLTASVHALGQVMNRLRSQIDLRNLRLVDRRLELSISAESLTLINRFQQQLQTAAPNFKVRVGVNEQDQGRFNSVITMELL